MIQALLLSMAKISFLYIFSTAVFHNRLVIFLYVCCVFLILFPVSLCFWSMKCQNNMRKNKNTLDLIKWQWEGETIMHVYKKCIQTNEPDDTCIKTTFSDLIRQM